MQFLMMFLIALAMNVAAYMLAPQPKTQEAQAGQLDVPTAEQGKAIPVVYGTVTVKSPNIIDYFGAATRAIRSGGGKK